MKPKILLFDLDQTLLASDSFKLKYHFIFRAIHLLHLRGLSYPEAYRFLKAMKSSLAGGNGQQTNAIRVYEVLRKIRDDLSLEDAKIWIDQWIEEVFAGLLQYFTPIPKAENLFFELQKSSQFRLVLATNPAWPKRVTEKRLARGRLKPEYFEWITAAEELFFTKPDVRYYEQILNYLHATPEECLMIGDSFRKDGIATKIGIPVFILSDKNRKHSNLLTEGTLESLKALLL